jgi:galacturonosyltransferase
VDDGKTGFLVEARNTQSLIDAVEKFINLPYQQKEAMGREARKKVEREFDRQIVVNEYLKAIREINSGDN